MILFIEKERLQYDIPGNVQEWNKHNEVPKVNGRNMIKIFEKNKTDPKESLFNKNNNSSQQFGNHSFVEVNNTLTVSPNRRERPPPK